MYRIRVFLPIKLALEPLRRKLGCNRICADIEEQFYWLNLVREIAGTVLTVQERGLDLGRETLDIEATRREARRSRNYKLDIVVVRRI